MAEPLKLPVDCDQLKHRFRSFIRGDLTMQRQHGFMARADAAAVKIVLPLSWTHQDRNVEFNLHAWRFLSPYWELFFREPTLALFDEMIALVQSWQTFVDSGKVSKFTWYDMSTGIRAAHLGLFKEILKEIDASEATVNLIDRLVIQHIEKLSNQKFITKGNHAIHQINGLRLLCSATGESSLDSYCEKNILSLINDAFDENYLCNENSPFYHKYNLSLIVQIQAELFPNIKDRINDVYQNARFITPWLSDVHGEFYQIGDSEGKGESLYNKICVNTLNVNDTIYTYKDLSASGMCFLRTMPLQPAADAFSFVFHGTCKTKIHAHVDHLSFILFHRGKELFSDSGKYTYNYGAWRDYFVSDSAHNTLGLVDFPLKVADLSVNSVTVDSMVLDGDYVGFSGSRFIENRFEHRRKITMKPGFELQICDEVLNKTTSPIEIRFHFSEQVQAFVKDDTCMISVNDEKFAVMHLDSGFLNIEVVAGQMEPHIQGWVSRSYHEKQPSQVLIVQYPAEVTRINTLINLI